MATKNQLMDWLTLRSLVHQILSLLQTQQFFLAPGQALIIVENTERHESCVQLQSISIITWFIKTSDSYFYAFVRFKDKHLGLKVLQTPKHLEHNANI